MFSNEFVKITTKVRRPGEGTRGRIEMHLELSRSNCPTFSDSHNNGKVFKFLTNQFVKNTPLARARTLSAGLALTVSPGIDQSEASWGERRPIGALVEPGSGSGRERVLVTWLQSQSDVGRDRAATAPSEISRQEWNMRIAESRIPHLLWRCYQACVSVVGVSNCPYYVGVSFDGEMWNINKLGAGCWLNWVSNKKVCWLLTQHMIDIWVDNF